MGEIAGALVMHATQTFALIAGVSLFVGADKIAEVVVPAPIEVHSLKYEQGVMLQDRTVRTQGDLFPANWRAAIYSAETMRPIPECVGDGFWNYTAGRSQYPIPIDEWVGREGVCTAEFLRSLDIDVYGVASWHWGDDKTAPFVSEVFRP